MPDRWVVVSLDGLAIASLGAYGSSWNETPAIDRMAAFGTVWDRAIACSDDSVDVLKALWNRSQNGKSWLDTCRRSGRVELFLNAGPQANRITTLAGELGFDQCTLVEAVPDADAMAIVSNDVETTAMAKLLIPVIERLGEPGSNSIRDWSVLWVHGDSLLRCWDAPRWLFPMDEDDDDEDDVPIDRIDWSIEDFELDSYDSESIAELPKKPPALFEAMRVPFFELQADSHPDLVTSWMQTYGCQIRLIDHLLHLLLEAIEASNGEIGLALIGTSGLSLGQNGWIGHRAGPIRSPQIHVPAVLFDGVGCGLRVPEARKIDEVTDWLSPTTSDGKAARMSPRVWGSDEANLELAIITQSRRAEIAVTTADWFFVREKGVASLFLKPDDRDDMNDVANRCRETVESMESTFFVP